MDDKAIKVNVTSEDGLVEIRTGEAKKYIDPVPLVFKGTFEAVRNFFKIRKPLLTDEEKSKTHLQYDRANLKCTLIINERDKFSDKISGEITYHDDFAGWGINKEGRTWKIDDLIKFVRVRSYMFPGAGDHKDFLTKLKSVKGIISTDFENTKDDRGNKLQHLQKKFESNIPEKIFLKCEVIKGYPPVDFLVEIGIEAGEDGARIWFISPDLIDREKDLINKIFVDLIKDFEGFPTLEQ